MFQLVKVLSELTCSYIVLIIFQILKTQQENLVALKCGPFDYHFMVRVDGIWYNKPGTTPLIENENYLNVISKVWKGRYINKNGNIKNDDSIYYDDVTIYFAIKKDWDK